MKTSSKGFIKAGRVWMPIWIVESGVERDFIPFWIFELGVRRISLSFRIDEMGVVGPGAASRMSGVVNLEFRTRQDRFLLIDSGLEWPIHFG